MELAIDVAYWWRERAKTLVCYLRVCGWKKKKKQIKRTRHSRKEKKSFKNSVRVRERVGEHKKTNRGLIREGEREDVKAHFFCSPHLRLRRKTERSKPFACLICLMGTETLFLKRERGHWLTCYWNLVFLSGSKKKKERKKIFVLFLLVP